MKRLIMLLLALLLCLPSGVSYGAIKTDTDRLKKMKEIETIIDMRYKQFTNVEFYKTLEIEMIDPIQETYTYSGFYTTLSQENRKKFAKHYTNYYNKQRFVAVAFNTNNALKRTKRYLENLDYLYSRSKFDEERWRQIDKEGKKREIMAYVNDYKNLKLERTALYSSINFGIKTMNKDTNKETMNVVAYFNDKINIFKRDDSKDKWGKIEEYLQLLNAKYSELN